MSTARLMKAWALALLLCAPLVQAAEEPGSYATQVPLTLSGDGPWYRLELPLALHLAAQHADLRDLRVFNAEGEPLAYALTLGGVQTRETREEAAVKWFPLQAEASTPGAPVVRVERSTNGTLVEVTPEQVSGERVRRGWLLDASRLDQPLHRLQLEWAADSEGFQRFSIEASDDLQRWSSWGEGQIARLSFSGERIDQREVALPGQKAKYLRLLWLAPQRAPELLGARLVSIHSELSTPLVWSEPLPGKVGKPGEYTWALPLSLPLERIKVLLDQPNTLAPVSLSSRRDGKLEWQPLARGLLYRLPQGDREMLHDQIELYGAPVSQLRLQVDERGGGLGKEAPQLQVALRSTQVVFLARGAAPYTLAIGKAGAISATLPLSTLVPGYEPERLTQLGVAKAEPLTAAAATAASEASQQGGNWKRYGLWAVLLAGVALLGTMAVSLLRKPSA